MLSKRTAGRGALVALGLTVSACATPRADRDWYPYLARTAHAERSAARFTISPVSDWRYAPSGPVSRDYAAATFELADLRQVWFVLEPHPGSDTVAHTLLLFEFEGDRLLGLTIEARREADEEYSALRGMWNAYELAYVWATARDLLIRRAVMLDHDVLIYPVSISDDQERALLTRLLDRTAALEAKPRFYNTLFSNCTNELAKAAGLSSHPSFILTGGADDHLYAAGIIPGPSFAAVRANARMKDFLTSLNASETSADFDARLLAELRRRTHATQKETP